MQENIIMNYNFNNWINSTINPGTGIKWILFKLICKTFIQSQFLANKFSNPSIVSFIFPDSWANRLRHGHLNLAEIRDRTPWTLSHRPLSVYNVWSLFVQKLPLWTAASPMQRPGFDQIKLEMANGAAQPIPSNWQNPEWTS